MELAETYRTLYSLRYVSITWVQVVFSAGTIFILSAVQATSGSRLAHVSLNHSLSQVDLCIQYLTETGRSWNCANNIAGILKSLRKEQLIPRLNMRSIDESRISSMRKGTASSLHSALSEDVKPPLTGSSIDSNAATVDEEVLSIKSSPPPDSANLSSFHPEWELGGNGNIPLMWNDPMASITGQQWGAPDLSYNNMGVSSNLSGMDILRQDCGGFPGLTGGETLPTQPFMPFGMPGPSSADSDYYHHQYGFSQEQHPRQLTEEDVEALNLFLSEHQHPG
jgi:hypothetical protein